MRPTHSPSAALRRTGFTLVEIMIVVAIIGLIAAAAMPSLISARKKATRTTCINNQRTIQSSKSIWALENKKGDSDVPTDADLVGPGKAFDRKPDCPAGGTYNYGAVAENVTCSNPDHVAP